MLARSESLTVVLLGAAVAVDDFVHLLGALEEEGRQAHDRVHEDGLGLRQRARYLRHLERLGVRVQDVACGACARALNVHDKGTR